MECVCLLVRHLGNVFQLVSLSVCLAPSMSQSICLSPVTYRYVIVSLSLSCDLSLRYHDGKTKSMPLSDSTGPSVSPSTATEIQANYVGSLND